MNNAEIYAAMIEELCDRAARAGYFNGSAAEARQYYTNTAYELASGYAGFTPQRNTFACWGTAKTLSRLERHVLTICEAQRRNEDPDLAPRVLAYYRREFGRRIYPRRTQQATA